jgi:thiol-disulfide isomerase/thioredoxin
MKKTQLFTISLVAIVALAAGLWLWRPTHAPIREHSPETILQHVRTSQAPLVLINFWASWCEPCKEELPALKQLKTLFPDKLNIVLISIDDVEESETAANYLRDNQLDFTAFYRGTQPLKFVTKIFPNWTGAVPATVLMNSQAQILDSWEGDATLDEFKKRVQKHMGGS